MKILFITSHPYLPQMYGGLQTSIDQLCRGLEGKGHDVSVLCGLIPGGWLACVLRARMALSNRLFGRKIASDRSMGYCVWRTWFPSEVAEYLVRRIKPDLVVVTTGKIVPVVEAIRGTRIPILAQLHDIEFHLHGGDFTRLKNLTFIANSQFTAQAYHRNYGIDCDIIYPLIDGEKYRVDSTRQNVTFINPHPQKGSDVALKVARLCPEIPFTFVRGWSLTPEQGEALAQELTTLPNVTVIAAQGDMREIYGACKILLVPSRWDETYGRVAVEAEISGIPVVASNRGGLPEAVGPGGILLDPDGPIEDWVAAIRRLWTDDEYYRAMSQAAALYANRPEVSLDYQIELHQQALLKACARK